MDQQPIAPSTFPWSGLPGIREQSVPRRTKASKAAELWCGSPQHRQLRKTLSTASTESSLSVDQGASCFPQHPALHPLGGVYLPLEKRTSSWRLHPATAISTNFAPHPAVRPLANWSEKDDGEDASEKGADSPLDNTAYPQALPLALIILGVCLSVFIIALDRTIVTTAIPAITAAFNSTDDIGWYGSAYLLTASAFQPLYGRIYGSFSVKASFLAALAVFELGSLICGVSPTSIALIIGRSIQGLGSAGILTGAFVIVTHAVPLQKRPLYFACVGILFGMGSLCGPLLGGVFTDLTTWRWCFYVNLPCGGLTFATVFLFFHPKHPQKGHTFLQRVLQLDLIGNAIILGASVMLFLALQYTENGTPWSSAEVIGLLVGAFLTSVLFVVWLWYKGPTALIPLRILRQRTVAASCLLAFFLYAALLMHTYYLPIYFEAVRNDSAIHAGVNMIPYMCANALFGLIAGIVVSKNGLFAAPAILGCAIGTIGAGLLSTLQVDTSSSMWIGYEILTSVGLGMAVQQGFTAVQTVLPLEDVPIGTAAVVACQSLGGAVFVSVGNTILQNALLSGTIPSVDLHTIFSDGATVFRKDVPAAALPAVLELYNSALRDIFRAAIVMSGLALLASLGMEWNRNVVKKESGGETAGERLGEGIEETEAR